MTPISLAHVMADGPELPKVCLISSDSCVNKVALREPESAQVAIRVLAIPRKREDKKLVGYPQGFVGAAVCIPFVRVADLAFSATIDSLLRRITGRRQS